MNKMQLFFNNLCVALVLIFALTAHGSNLQNFSIKGFDGNPVDEFIKEYSKYWETLQESKKLQKLIEVFQSAKDDDNLLCGRCHAIVDLIINMRRANAPDGTIISIMQDLCVKFNYTEKTVCETLPSLYSSTIFYIIDNTPKLNASQVCGLIYQRGSCKLTDPRFDWKVNINYTKPNKTAHPSISNLTILNVLHLSDIHYDPKYQEGANALCGKTACCRIDQGIVQNLQDRAGKWGDYRGCDTPEIAMMETFDHIKKNHHNIDYIYFTGDVVDHGMWETTRENNIKVLKKVLLAMMNINTKVFPVLGNHESHPGNLFVPKYINEELNMGWLYETMYHGLNVNYNNSNDLETIKKGGYYSILVKPGFRIIALNNNVAYIFNFWLLYDPAYPKEQLQWLHDTLLKAEQNNEKVHILAHVPAGERTNFFTWDREYRRIVERFSDIITSQFNGHSHNDEFKIFYNSSNSSIPINSAFNGGSVTSYVNRNPNYKIYKVESKNYTILDFESWYYNLTAANLKNASPEWKQMYVSFKTEFGLNSVNNSELNNLVLRMKTNQQLSKKYFEYKVKRADPELDKGCDKDCLTYHLCEIVTTAAFDDDHCNNIIKSDAQTMQNLGILILGIVTGLNLWIM